MADDSGHAPQPSEVAHKAVRPTKKQRELLLFIEQFISQHGYSPSYREIMQGCQYNSVATVALHVGNLIKRGHVRKRDHSARSLEVVTNVGGLESNDSRGAAERQVEAWLKQKADELFEAAEIDGHATEALRAVVTALAALGCQTLHEHYNTRLQALEAAGG